MAAGGFSLLSLLFTLFIYPMFGALGGVLATALLGGEKKSV